MANLLGYIAGGAAKGFGEGKVGDIRARREEIKAQLEREFRTSEREAGQEFRAGESDKDRGFRTSEREAGQEFTSGQNDLNRRHQTDLANQNSRNRINEQNEQTKNHIAEYATKADLDAAQKRGEFARYEQDTDGTYVAFYKDGTSVKTSVKGPLKSTSRPRDQAQIQKDVIANAMKLYTATDENGIETGKDWPAIAAYLERNGDPQTAAAIRKKLEKKEPIPEPAEGESGPGWFSRIFGSGKRVEDGKPPVVEGQGQAKPPAAPRDPAQRTVGTIYTAPNGKQGRWTGKGWEIVQ